MEKEFKILSIKEEQQLSKEELKEYYEELRKYYYDLGDKSKGTEFVHGLFNKITKYMRKYPVEVDMKDFEFYEPVIFACNHSNMHDYYTLQEVFVDMVNTLAASDGISNFVNFLFKISGCVLIDRNDKQSCFNGVNEIVRKLLNGNNACIFPEATWNIHPSKLMLPIKMGVIQIAAKSGCPIVPVIFEYIEKDELCSKESELYDRCIIGVGKPIYVDTNDNYLEKLEEVRDGMATVRWKIWESLGEYKRKDLSEDIYFNHTDIKCNSDTFSYDDVRELPRIYGSDNYIYQDYPINRVLPDKGKILVKVKR